MKYTKIIITLIATLGIIIHAFYPNIKIDSISIVLFFIATLPWLSFLLEELELPGGWRFKFKNTEVIGQRAIEAGLISETSSEDEDKYSFQIVGSSDKNLALAGLRIELEKNLKEIAELNNIGTKMQGLGRIMQLLSDKNLISLQEKSVLADIIGLLNNAVHGAKIDDRAFELAMEYGEGILKSLEIRKTSHNMV